MTLRSASVFEECYFAERPTTLKIRFGVPRNSLFDGLATSWYPLSNLAIDLMFVIGNHTLRDECCGKPEAERNP